MGKFETKFKVGTIIVGILSVLGIISAVVGFVKGIPDGRVWSYYVNVIMYILIFVYAFWGFKKPHGNMLKYLFILFAASLMSSIYSNVLDGAAAPALMHVICVLLIGYIAGRLDRIIENRVLMIVVFLILVYMYIGVMIFFNLSFIGSIGVMSPLIMWIGLCVAYLTRYKQHKEAGLMDAPKK